MASSFSFNEFLHQHELFFSFSHLSKYPSPFSLHHSYSLSTLSASKHGVHPKFYKLLVDRTNIGHTQKFPKKNIGHTHGRFPKTGDEITTNDVNLRIKRKNGSRVSSSRSVRVKEKDSAEKRLTKPKNGSMNLSLVKESDLVNGGSFFASKDEKIAIEDSKTKDIVEVEGETGKTPKVGGDNMIGGGDIQKKDQKNNNDSTGVRLRVELDMCSKRGDVMGAIQLYEKSQIEGIKMGQHHYTVILYLCSSAAVGVVRPAKSGRSGGRILSKTGVSNASSESSIELGEAQDQNHENDILVSNEIKKYALQRGFEIYEKMRKDNIPMNEASLTAVARMAMAMGDGDMAFDMVKQMKSLGINPRLRSYAPAISAFCSSKDIEKAFEVEKHMLENGVYPEEPELEALFRLSVETGKADKVYYLLHKLRTTVRCVSPVTADIITNWFKSKAASRVGKKKWDSTKLKEEIKNKGGGWHVHGWLGRGKWIVSNTVVGADGFCRCCKEKLGLIDLDPEETDKFARSVASIAMTREKSSNFERFQKWLDYYGPFEAVVDAANVGLFSQKKFMPSKVNAVVNGIRQMLPSRKWPLIVLHRRRVTGPKMDEPSNKALIEKWKNADALYATPTGSNDDWYWLYAAMKFKCLIVTNDEMRDHTFQLLGNDFFSNWKERHQVRFSFTEAGPVFHMPPSCTVVIQESEKGHWHIPVSSKLGYEEDRTWLCIARANSLMARPVSATGDEEFRRDKGQTGPTTPAELKVSHPLSCRNIENIEPTQIREAHRRLKDILSGSDTLSNQRSILSELEAAEKLGCCTIDFQI